jgi:hypothetical protein
VTAARKEGANESFRIVNTAWNGALTYHVGQNGKYVAKTSLMWQMCKINCKGDF